MFLVFNNILRKGFFFFYVGSALANIKTFPSDIYEYYECKIQIFNVSKCEKKYIYIKVIANL